MMKSQNDFTINEINDGKFCKITSFKINLTPLLIFDTKFCRNDLDRLKHTYNFVEIYIFPL